MLATAPRAELAQTLTATQPMWDAQAAGTSYDMLLQVGNAEGEVLIIRVADGQVINARLIPLRLSRPADSAADDPVDGGQLQARSMPGVPAEGQVQTEWQDIRVQLAGGEIAILSVLSYRIANPAYGPLAPDLRTSPRLAPPLADPATSKDPYRPHFRADKLPA